MRACSLFVAMAISLLSLASCRGLDCVEGNGEMTTEERTLPLVNGITIQGSADVKITQGPQPSLRVEAESNIVPLITTAVENGMLTIDTRECYMTSKPVTIHVATPTIASLRINGSGSITAVTSLATESLEVMISGSGDVVANGSLGALDCVVDGSGDIVLKGRGTSANYTIRGSGNIEAMDLALERATVVVDGSGDVAANVSQQLKVTISGSGDVLYTGPVTDVQSTLDGSGTVNRR